MKLPAAPRADPPATGDPGGRSKLHGRPRLTRLSTFFYLSGFSSPTRTGSRMTARKAPLRSVKPGESRDASRPRTNSSTPRLSDAARHVVVPSGVEAIEADLDGIGEILPPGDGAERPDGAL